MAAAFVPTHFKDSLLKGTGTFLDTSWAKFSQKMKNEKKEIFYGQILQCTALTHGSNTAPNPAV